MIRKGTMHRTLSLFPVLNAEIITRKIKADHYTIYCAFKHGRTQIIIHLTVDNFCQILYII